MYGKKTAKNRIVEVLHEESPLSIQQILNRMAGRNKPTTHEMKMILRQSEFRVADTESLISHHKGFGYDSHNRYELSEPGVIAQKVTPLKVDILSVMGTDTMTTNQINDLLPERKLTNRQVGCTLLNMKGVMFMGKVSSHHTQYQFHINSWRKDQ